MSDPQVDQILHFWFEETPPKRWWVKDPGFDTEIGRRFAGLSAAAVAGEVDWSEDGPLPALAMILLLDQFPRNLHRDSPAAFAGDAKARAIADRLVRRDWDRDFTQPQRQFAYMPFMHSEDLADQDRCVALIEERLPGHDALKHAHIHRDIIVRFGRFPHRNPVLGRESTAEEIAFLEQGGFAG